MIFSSIIFIFYFLPLVLLFYYLIKRPYRNIVLFFFSLVFYLWGGIEFLIIMFLSILCNYIFGILIHKSNKQNTKRIYLVLSLLINIGVLIYYKYTGFLVNSCNDIFNTSITIKKIIMPLGISFYTFKGVSYIVDVYRKEVPANKKFVDLGLYISFFPQILAGPIVRYKTMEKQLKDRKENFDLFISGIERFILGCGKKIFIANTIAQISDDIFSLNVSNLPTSTAWIGAIAYTFQIYFDFSAYSDMAIGICRMFGFEVQENFNYPYISKSITEFWRRWHISLGTWFREYVYISLGGNRVRVIRNIFNLLVVWSLTGLWHGASMNFVLWGLLYFILLVVEKFLFNEILNKTTSILRHIYVMFFVMIGWVLFRSPDIKFAIIYLKRMFIFNDVFSIDKISKYYLSQYSILFIVCIVFSTPIYLYLQNKTKGILNYKVFFYGKMIFIYTIFIISIIYLLNSTFNPFIYFKF